MNERLTADLPEAMVTVKRAKTVDTKGGGTVQVAEPRELDAVEFRRKLMGWYKAHARELPWRGVGDAYRTWVSEVMLQQTRVAAVIDHYQRFMREFPTVVALALAPEAQVLAAWSGLGYYRRARMLHRAAQFIVAELDGVLPGNSVELRTLPGVGEYTSAAIASIAFGESIAVVDGNVERVLLRLTGRAEEGTAEARKFVQRQASALVPKWQGAGNAPGDHNQAMMELGATICVPRGPLCLNCPVYAMCRTRGEHVTLARTKQRSLPVAYLLMLRKREVVTEVLLVQRPAEASLMAGMLELPPLPQDVVGGREPVLRLRHSITNTNYYVEVFSPASSKERKLKSAVPVASGDMRWVKTSLLGMQPLTGLARKVLQRLGVMAVKDVVLEEKA